MPRLSTSTGPRQAAGGACRVFLPALDRDKLRAGHAPPLQAGCRLVGCAGDMWHADAVARSLLQPPGDQALQTFLQADWRAETDRLFGLLDISKPPAHGVDLPLLLVLNRQVRLHHPEQRLSKLQETRLLAAGYVQNQVCGRRPG